MSKSANEKEEAIKSLLLYPDNLAFMKRETKFPQNAKEIMNNIRMSMGGSIAFEENPMAGFILYGIIILICAVCWLALGYATLDHFFNITGLQVVRIRRAGAAMVIVMLALTAFTGVIIRSLFRAMRYSPKRMKMAYATLLQQGKATKGSVVSAKVVNGIYIITYRLASSESNGIESTYRTLKRKGMDHKPGDRLVVWQLDEAIHTLL